MVAKKRAVVAKRGRAPKFLTRGIWPRLRAMARGKGRVLAAVPYFATGGAARLTLKKDDLLVTRFDDSSIKCGQTDPREILTLIKRGVRVYAAADLHAKVYVFGNTAIVGSANVSSYSEHYLMEAGLETKEVATVRACRRWIESIASEVVEPAFAESKLGLYRPPRFFGPLNRKAKRGAAKAPSRRAPIWIMRLRAEDWDEPAYEAEKAAKHEGMERLLDPGEFRQDTFRMIGRASIAPLRIGHRVVQILGPNRQPEVFAPGRIVAIRRYTLRGGRFAIVSLEMRKGTRTKSLSRVVGQLGKKAGILKKVKGQRLLTDPILIHELGRLWK